MNYIDAIEALIYISEQEEDNDNSPELARNILDHIEEYGGSMIVKNNLDVNSIIKIAYASEISDKGIVYAYDEIIGLYNWMLEVREGPYRIELTSVLVSLPTSSLVVYSNALPRINGFLRIQLAISGSKLDVDHDS